MTALAPRGFENVSIGPPQSRETRPLPPRVPLQAKLEVGAVDDVLEEEADHVAERVMRMADPAHANATAAGEASGTLQRECDKCEEEDTVQRKTAGTAVAAAAAPPIVHEVLGEPGQPLDAATRAFMEPRFGRDFANVRVHTGAKANDAARSVGALAFTRGTDVVFRRNLFEPATDTGRRLLAHELVHTIQQDAASRRVQRTVDCSIDWVVNECNGAAASCAAIQGSYCASKYPNAAALDTLHQNATNGAKGDAAAHPNAAANLLHFLDGSGTERVLAVDLFRNDSATTSKLENEHRDKFIAGAQRRLGHELTPGGPPVEMAWTGTANAFSLLNRTDLGLAVGGYTLCSKVTVAAASTGGGVRINFNSWTVQAFDCYNWDPGKGIGMPGADDNDLCCLENAGRAAHFRIRTDPWANTDGTSMAPADLSAPAPIPSPTPPVPGDGGGGSGGGSGGDRRSTSNDSTTPSSLSDTDARTALA